MHYWDILKSLQIQSLQRKKRERYQIIYIWKILEKLVPNIENQMIERNSSRRGRYCFQNTIKRSPYQNLRCSSLTINGAKFFICIPKKIRNMKDCPKENFKNALDKYLKLIPDEPQIPGYTAERRTNSNIEQYDACVSKLNFRKSSTAARWWKSEDFWPRHHQV